MPYANPSLPRPMIWLGRIAVPLLGVLILDAAAIRLSQAWTDLLGPLLGPEHRAVSSCVLRGVLPFPAWVTLAAAMLYGAGSAYREAGGLLARDELAEQSASLTAATVLAWGTLRALPAGAVFGVFALFQVRLDSVVGLGASFLVLSLGAALGPVQLGLWLDRGRLLAIVELHSIRTAVGRLAPLSWAVALGCGGLSTGLLVGVVHAAEAPGRSATTPALALATVWGLALVAGARCHGAAPKRQDRPLTGSGYGDHLAGSKAR